jgi:acetyltransferase-like isoleucine patch superfamily enzyme
VRVTQLILFIAIKIFYRIPRKAFNYSYNYLSFKYNRVEIGANSLVNGRIFIKNSFTGEIKIGENFKANSGIHCNPIGGDSELKFVTNGSGSIQIGDDVGISNSALVSWSAIQIKNKVYIGGGCKIWDTNFHSINPEIRTERDDEVNSSPITIEDKVFIGGGTTILKGVHIGENSIIAAMSVVTKSIPANEIWGGNPAKKIRDLTSI